jgi:hypothetical protein
MDLLGSALPPLAQSFQVPGALARGFSHVFNEGELGCPIDHDKHMSLHRCVSQVGNVGVEGANRIN